MESTSAAALCATLARLKAEAVVNRLRQHGRTDPIVLGCDSLLEFDGADPRQAGRRARRPPRAGGGMRGRSGVLHTGHCLVRVGDGEIAEAVASTTVCFADLTDAGDRRVRRHRRTAAGRRRLHHRRPGRLVRRAHRGRRRQRDRRVPARTAGASHEAGGRRRRPVGGSTSVDGMSFKSIGLCDDLHAYLVAHNGPADPLVAELIAETHRALPGTPRTSRSRRSRRRS